jgi:peptidoglycan hydrolase CwlO-like protein
LFSILIRKQVIQLELERDKLQNSLQIIEQQNKSSSETNHQILKEVASLKTTIEQLHQQMNEREQILVKYPDVNGHNQPIPSK